MYWENTYSIIKHYDDAPQVMNIPVILLCIAAGFALYLGVYLRTHKVTKGNLALSWLQFSIAIWCISYAIEIISHNKAIMLAMLAPEYLGIAATPVLWLIYVLQYTDRDRWLKRQIPLLLFIVPAITVIMSGTNGLHHLFYDFAAPIDTGKYTYLATKPGIFWWIHTIYSYIIFSIGFFIIIHQMVTSTGVHKNHALLLALASIVPFSVNAIYISGVKPFGFLDPTPIAFTIMGLILIVGIFSRKLFRLTPFALDNLFRNLQDAIFVTDQNLHIVNLNPAAAAMLYSTEKKLLGRPIKDFPELPISNQVNVKKTSTQIKINDRWNELISNPIFNQQGLLIGNLHLIRDIDKAMKAEEELNKLSELQQIILKIALEYINLNLEVLDESINQSLKVLGEFVEADRAYIFDYDWQTRTCSNTFEWCAPGISAEISNLQNVPIDDLMGWETKHLNNQPVYIDDVPGLQDDDPTKAILNPQGIKSLITIPITDYNDCLGFIGFDSVVRHHYYTEKEKTLLFVFAQILANLKKRALLEKNLRLEKNNAQQASKHKSEFLANMSHEIRTPLNGVIGYADLLSQTTLDEIQTQYTDNIITSAQTLLSLISDILDFSKIEAGKLELERIPVHITHLTNDVLNIVKVAAAKKKIQLISQLPEDLPAIIYGDPLRIKQILINLLSNAIKFTEQGEVVLSITFTAVSAKEGVCSFSVRDTGIGMSYIQQSQLFKAFSQADNSTTRRFGGSGLGLAISALLAQKMGSIIGVESELGKGSNFYFSLEVQYATEIPQPELVETQEKKQSNKNETEKLKDHGTLTILVAEDVPLNMMLAKTYLKKFMPGATLLEASNGSEAVALSQLHHPQLIFMDLHMPVMDGIAATCSIRALEQQNNTTASTIVALTAGALQEEREKCLAAGMDHFLTKPIQPQLLKQILVQVVEGLQAP